MSWFIKVVRRIAGLTIRATIYQSANANNSQRARDYAKNAGSNRHKFRLNCWRNPKSTWNLFPCADAYLYEVLKFDL